MHTGREPCTQGGSHVLGERATLSMLSWKLVGTYGICVSALPSDKKKSLGHFDIIDKYLNSLFAVMERRIRNSE